MCLSSVGVSPRLGGSLEAGVSELRPEGGTDKGLVIEESRERLLGDRA